MQELFKRAESKASEKGHKLGAWNKIKNIWTNNCIHCNSEVRVHRSPHLGFDRIKGPAIYEYCFKGLSN